MTRRFRIRRARTHRNPAGDAARFFVASFALLAALWLASCEKNQLGPLDTPGNVPYIVSTSLAPDSLDIDGITPSGGTYTVTTILTAQVADPTAGGGISQVKYQVLAPASGDIVAAGDLAPAQSFISSSHTYAATISFGIQRTETGLYEVQTIATGAGNLTGNTVRHRLLIQKDAVPVIGIPSYRRNTPVGSDSSKFSFNVTVTDSNGLGQIGRVWVQARLAVDTSEHMLYDDGNKAGGDAAAGDGIYSGIIWVHPTGNIGNVTFEFHAADKAGRQALPVVRRQNNLAPSFVSLDVPSTVVRPTGADTAKILFAVTVTDPDGLGDIDSVYFRNYTPTISDVFLMYDDGDIQGDGDQVAGDGTYSRIVILTAGNTPGPKEFHFTVVDRAGATVDTAQTITVQ